VICVRTRHNPLIAGTLRLRGTHAALAAGAALLLAAPPALAAPGASGTGDSVYPHLGNGGYDVEHYDLDLAYAPKRSTISGRMTITATATQELSSFSLDMRHWLRARTVTVNGVAAATRQKGAKLNVTPPAAIANGAQFTVSIPYGGRPRPVDGSGGRREGWIPTRDGGMVASEPEGTPSWIPSNSSLTDKASWEMRFAVPKPLKAISNGLLLEVRRAGRKRVWRWAESQPMVPYLATVAIGRFRLHRSTVGGVPSIVAVDPTVARGVPKGIKRTAGILELFTSRFGPYPFDSIGAIVEDGPASFGLETQTRPIYDFAPPGGIHAHEIAHQYFGDSVGFGRWQDIWLAEGFAQWSMWLWRDFVGNQSLKSSFRRAYSVPDGNIFGFYWRPAPGAILDPDKLFSISVYERGAMTVEALRREIGDDAFYATIRDWLESRRYGTGTVPDFIALAEAKAGRDLDAFFNLWLFQKAKPTGPMAHAG
jgi:aminopeptidase N